jgi:hypothetical protein
MSSFVVDGLILVASENCQGLRRLSWCGGLFEGPSGSPRPRPRLLALLLHHHPGDDEDDHDNCFLLAC